MSREPWPLRLAVREGFEHAVTSQRTGALVVAACALLCGVVGAANAVDVSRLDRSEQAWLDAGGHAWVVQSATDEGIDVGLCERLRAVDGVTGAFAASFGTDTATPSRAPGTPVTLVAVSPGIWDFLEIEPSGGTSIIATDGAVKLTGVRQGEQSTFRLISVGSTVASSDVRATVVTADTQVFPDQLETAFLVPSLTSGSGSLCMVQSDAPSSTTIEAMIGQWLAGEQGIPAVVQPRLSADTYGVDFSTAYADRTSRWGWLIAAFVLCGLWGIVAWTQRARRAIYATFGAPKASRVLIQWVEWCVLSAVGVLWGAATSLAWTIALGAEPRVAVTQVVLGASLTWLAASAGAVGVAAIPDGSLLDALKDRS